MFLFYLLCSKYAGGFFSFVKSFVSEDDRHLHFFPMKALGQNFLIFVLCAIDMIFDNCADVFEVLNDNREYFCLFLMV